MKKGDGGVQLTDFLDNIVYAVIAGDSNKNKDEKPQLLAEPFDLDNKARIYDSLDEAIAYCNSMTAVEEGSLKQNMSGRHREVLYMIPIMKSHIAIVCGTKEYFIQKYDLDENLSRR